MSRATAGILSGLAAASIWGAMYVVSKVVLDIIPPFALITTRLLLGGLPLYLVILRRGPLRIAPADFWQSRPMAVPGHLDQGVV